MPEWTRACGVEEVRQGQMFGFEHGGKKILLANQDGTVRAVDMVCTHADADLSLGFLGSDGVRCPLHLSVFCLGDGRPQNPPAEAPLRVYNVKIDSGGVYVEV